MKNHKLALTLSLTLAWLGSTALAQTTNESPPTVPADTKPKAATKTTTKAAPKVAAKSVKKDETKNEEPKALTPGPAVVKGKNVNVRGKAAINSEVVAHLKRGDHIDVLEEVTLKNPKTDEPAKWAKIALPTNAPVWIHASFVDSASKTVVPKKLNLRGGPGENYSVVGTMTKGMAVKEIETKGDWMRIEAPTNSYAFVAAHFIANEAAPVTTALASTTVPKPPPPAPVTTTPPPAPVETPVASTKPAPVGGEPIASTPPPATTVTSPIVSAPVASPIVVPPPVAAEPPPPAPTPTPANNGFARIAAEPSTPAGPAKPDPEEDVKRVVTREGIVQRSVSIQAPTYFVLENLRNGKTINYLYSPSTNLVLKDFRGKRVMVSGEEELDERWPNTPVITIDKLETVP